jgi:hypothetical protein
MNNVYTIQELSYLIHSIHLHLQRKYKELQTLIEYHQSQPYSVEEFTSTDDL